MLKKNEKFEVTIEKDAGNGAGIAYIDDFVVFVNETVAGDKVKVKIVGTKPSYATAIVEKIIEKSPYRRENFCKHEKKCGGCDFSHINYDRQLVIKKENVINNLERIGKIKTDEIEVFDTIAMEKPIEYRNKMVFPIGRDEKNTLVGGFFEQKSHKIVSMSMCGQGPASSGKYLYAVLEYMTAYGVNPYDEKTHTGLIRRVFLRFGKKSKEAMVVISVNGKKLPNSEKLVESILAVKDNEYTVKSIVLNINKQKNNLVLGSENITIYGKNYITDSLLDIKFEISPHSFYQVNPIQTEILYKKAIEFAGLNGSETVIDLYCGIGTISLVASKFSKKVIGVEIVSQAIADAKKNAVKNGITNVEFVEGSADVIADNMAKSGTKADVVFIDPPRKGSDETTLISICKMNPEKIVYISCNPSTLARDLLFLNNNGYKTKKVQPVDMFPNTTHIETVALLEKV